MKLLILIKLCYLKEVNSFFTSKIFIKKIKVNINLKSSIEEYTHLLDYLPYRQEGLGAWEDFRTSPIAPTTLRDRKMYLKFFSFFNFEKKNLESVLDDPLWPSKWPFGNEDFRPFDYTRDEVINILPQYSYSQSLIKSDQIQIIPGLFRLPTRRHFILPKDKISLSDHMSIMLKNYVGIDDNREGLRVLELFSCYESILPTGKKLGPTIGIGWDNEEIESNADIDDYIIQDITIDPYIPLKSNYFDIVIIPANIQLLQRPLTLFQEINRVLKVGGYCFAGLKLCHWSFLTNKLGRYYAETNYLEDIYTLGAFFHYSQGYTKPKAYDNPLRKNQAI